MFRFSRLSDPRVIFWLACGLFIVFYGAVLDRLPHNLDEGVNLFNARFIAMGKRPYVDFFYHQLPLHLFGLSFISSIASESVFLHRLPSLFAVAATGGFLYLLAARLASPSVAALSAALYYSVPLQHLALLVLPNAPMMFFSTCSIYLILFRDRATPLILGAGCLLLAVLLKPLALATAVVIVVLLILDPTQRWKLTPLTLVLTVGGLLSFLGLHLLSQGAFTDLLELQLDRYTRKTGFQMMQRFTTVPLLLDQLGVRSFLAWNLDSHFRAFSGNNVPILASAVGGAWLVWRGVTRLPPRGGALLALWLIVPFLFSLFVWEPAWEHYHLQYLPPLAILAALFLRHLLTGSTKKRAVRLLVPVWLAWALAAGPLTAIGTLRDYGSLTRLAGEAPALLTFDPFLNVVTRTEAACGVTDPLAQFSPAFFRDRVRFFPFVRSSEQIIDCLEQSPEVKILISTLQPASLWFFDEKLYRYVQRQERSRVIYLREGDEAAFRRLFGRPRKP